MNRGLAAKCRIIAALAVVATPTHAQSDLAFVSDIGPSLKAGATVIDVRSEAACAESTIAGARCLPATDLLGPHRRLANFREILWLLGTVGLTGRETVLVVGDSPQMRDFVAGILHLAGQAEVRVLKTVLSNARTIPGENAGPGIPRGFTRSVVFEAPMREQWLVLGAELAGAIEHGDSPVLIDGRSEEEYWGALVLGTRGGHIAGAQQLPATSLRAGMAPSATPMLRNAIAYAHDAVDGFAYFALLHSAGLHARIYPAGWAEWSTRSDWPADAETYPQVQRTESLHQRSSDAGGLPDWRVWLVPLLGGVLVGAMLTAIGFALGRHRRAS